MGGVNDWGLGILSIADLGIRILDCLDMGYGIADFGLFRMMILYF